MMAGFGFFGLLFMIIFWGGLIGLGVWAVKGLFPNMGGRPGPEAGPTKNAHGILDQRYARGEISREQYEMMKNDIVG